MAKPSPWSSFFCLRPLNRPSPYGRGRLRSTFSFRKSWVRAFVIFNLSFLISQSAFAETKDLIINGDHVSYDKENQLVDARINVEILYKDVSIYGDNIQYDAKADLVKAKGGFILNYKDISLEGDTLDYEIKLKEGSATGVGLIYRGLNLKGKKINLHEDSFELHDATFTTCNEKHPHYRVTASDINIYPEYGWLVAYWAYFWFDGVPVVPMPTYIYDLYAEEKARNNVPPFPDIGSNDEDGTYINERLAWHIRRELSGTYSISYLTKKGWGGGLEANYILSDDSQGSARFYSNGSDGISAGLTHKLFFGESREDPYRTFSFIHLPKKRQYELETLLSFRERINYERVSFLPGITLRSAGNSLIGEAINYDYDLGTARIFEEDSVTHDRNISKLKLYKPFHDLPVGTLTPYLGADASFYSGGGRWFKGTSGVDIKKSFSKDLYLGLGYLHYLKISGASPFIFENYRFIPQDKLTSDILFKFWGLGLGVSTSYYIDTWQPEDIDYLASIDMHCYNLAVKYRSIRQEFSLGFGLITVD